ncbi:hypothetical protein BJ878DRAFT_455799 [Calycina marina]|uniref:V-type c subunit family protein n=1 Tax=Calycina marina TaxID=1763456 RepID=A0A9P7Z7F3_9HELO|nr:hypothetical protein BJ878DRAFT_455799 [Calycina marina]
MGQPSLRASSGLRFFTWSTQKTFYRTQRNSSTASATVINHRPWNPTPPRQLTLEIKFPASTSKESIVSSLTEHLLHKKTRHYQWPRFFHLTPGGKSDHILVILATPTFASWLEDYNTFMPLVLKKWRHSLLPYRGSGRQNQKNNTGTFEEFADADWKFNVVCACVDGIASVEASGAIAASEGFSFMQARTSGIAPKLWESQTASERNPLPSTLTFVSESNVHDDATKQCYTVTLPLAKTLFTNGKMSTLIASQWVSNGDGFDRVRTEEKSNVNLETLEGLGSVYIPAIQLTPARMISSGMGNIVRQVERDGVSIPASEELEASIDAYLEKTQKEKSAVQVWALIIPASKVSEECLEDGSSVRYNSDQIVQNLDSESRNDFIGDWIKSGATLCRIFSGGGGWGAKKGLLSLDPQTAYRESPDSEMKYSGGSVEDQRALALGNLANTDSYIQFFAAQAPESRADEHMKSNFMPLAPSDSEKKSRPSARTSLVLGSVPSTIDKVPGTQTTSIQSDYDTAAFPRKGHFGAVSESGLYVDTQRSSVVDKDTVHTKIDLPYSSLRWSFTEALTGPVVGLKEKELNG